MGASNPVVYFEIPVNDINRAKEFYSSVFGFKFTDEVLDGYEMALFPFAETGSGITGALAKGDVYKPTQNGVIIYFKTDDIDAVLQRATEQGGKVLYPKTVNASYGVAIAEFEDSEGNRIALQQRL